MKSAVQVRVPGKLLLTGEYAVLEGKPAIVAAVSRFVECAAAPSEKFEILGAGLHWSEGCGDVPGLNFAQQALNTVRRYLEGRGVFLPPHRFEIRDDLRAPDGQKLGLGGSACVCACVTAAALQAARISSLEKLSSERILDRFFKLASIAHVLAQKKTGSCVDVAASVFGGVILTHRFNFDFFEPFLKKSPQDFAEAIDSSPLHPIVRLPPPPAILLLFGGKSASTPLHVASVRAAAARHPEKWDQFLGESEAATLALRRALECGSMDGMIDALESAFHALDDFSASAGVDVEITPLSHRRLREMAAEAGAAAKPSGAGGGDVAFALGEKNSLLAMEARLKARGETAFLVEAAASDSLF